MNATPSLFEDPVVDAVSAPADADAVIGKSVTRLEDRVLVRGEGLFAADVNFPRQLHMRVVRSQVPHGLLLGVDMEAARQLPGVVAVWSGADVAEIPPIPFRATKVQGLEPYCQPILAQGYVRYVGEPVAVVFAHDAYVAEDAAALVQPDIEVLPPLMDAREPTREFAPGLSTEPTVIRKGYGDVDAAFATAWATVELDLAVGRHSGVPLECRGAVARYDASRGVLEMHGAAKKSHWNRDEMAKMLGLPPSTMHLYEGHVGGGFGVRGELYPEDVLVCLAAMRLRRPIKWVEDRRENLLATNHSREQYHRIAAAIDADGRILGIRNRFFHSQGAYVRTHGPRVADMSAGLLLGPYRVPAYDVAAHYRLTNKTPAATYRAPGRYETTFVRERLMDAIAVRAGIDPQEARRRNLIDKSEMPYTRPLDALGVDVVLDSGDYAGLLDKTLARADWPRLRQDIARRREQGERVGLGLAMFVEKSGLGPSDTVRLTVDRSGALELVTGAGSVGQGMETALAQICAHELGVDYQSVRVIRGRTDQIEFGNGAHASRVTVMSGSATQIAARKVRDKALDVASKMLGVAAEALHIRGGVVRPRGDAVAPGVSLAQVASYLHPSQKTSDGYAPGLSAEGWFYSEHMNYPYGIHIAQVRLDEGTGIVHVEKYWVSYDVGRAVNPKMIEGQIVGGLAQGLGGALFEQFTYDASGQPLSTTFADYLMITAHEMPPVDVLITEDAPSPLNPLGLKGAGEGGTNAAGAAIAAAVDDALGRPGAIDRLPVLPEDVIRHLAAPRA
ncbi:xanthine dehydrogenase family protein molybdopterin-binding subunit [Hydrogenophaga sp. BPS33]|uniref:xanthine dehydrogenase family protein molybdopterin-binding subunit n=1 Tax=Hydrogenophaga sp. BPS33 TaxID=2651974 RepID=UPI00131F8CA1|nr:xanthine dehydrogenase family protein molybdopterin-binding subunit [Hydrogenophaga sp. BPS33]QHE84963.1 xanthine dehydrogenase family protein molybdopterin-binding subunit [Hydrogenophaga sp. BPS33]